VSKKKGDLEWLRPTPDLRGLKLPFGTEESGKSLKDTKTKSQGGPSAHGRTNRTKSSRHYPRGRWDFTETRFKHQGKIPRMLRGVIQSQSLSGGGKGETSGLGGSAQSTLKTNKDSEKKGGTGRLKKVFR